MDSVVLEAVVALICLVGIAGTILPLLPGSLLCGGAIVGWAVFQGGYAWLVAAVAVAILVLGAVLKYLIPGKRLKGQGVPSVVLLIGGLLGIVGFFLIPVIGLVLGFVLGVYLAEAVRSKSARDAWPTTVAAMKAAGISTLIELAAALLATSVWFAAVVTGHVI